MSTFNNLFSRFVQTTSNETSNHFFSKRSNFPYICDAVSTSRKGHYLWLSNACADGLSFLHFTKKDNHMHEQTSLDTTSASQQIEEELKTVLQSKGFFLPDLLALSKLADGEKERCDNLLNALRQSL